MVELDNEISAVWESIVNGDAEWLANRMKKHKSIIIFVSLLIALFLYSTANGEYTYTEALTSFPTGFPDVYLNGISNNGIITMSASAGTPGSNRGLIYDNGTYTEFLPTGTISSGIIGINDNGVVLGYGFGSTGSYKYFIATPVVPEPISSILFITGGVTLGFRRFRKTIKN